MLVLVETISQFRMRYLIETNDNHPEWALDSVVEGHVNNKVIKEFSQEHLGETVFSHRTVTEQDALDLFRKDNNYLATWSDNKIKEVGFNLAGDSND